MEREAIAEGLLERNLALLRKRWPDMARRVEEAPPLPDGALREGKGGEPTLCLSGEDGKQVYLHSRYDPRDEARKQLSVLAAQPGDTVVLLGIGLGYQLEALLDEARAGLVIAVERDPAVMRAALSRTTFEPFLTREGAELVVGGGPGDFFLALERRLARIFSSSMRVMVHPPSVRAFPAWYEGVVQGLREFTKHGAVALRSALYLSRVSLENRLANIPQYVESAGVRPLLGRFAGFPAVVVSAGPSLDRNLHLLKELSGKAVILAVSTALKILLGRGIRPDLAVVIDYHPISERYFQSIPPEEAPLLVADLKASPAAVSAFSGKKLFGADPFVDLLLEGAAGDKGPMAGGSTVAHAAFDIARRLGCDPIIFVGQDLSYPEGRLHAAGSAISAQQLPETNRFYTLEMKEWEYYLLHRKGLSRIPGALGGEVWTCDVFLTYLREFEKMFRESPQKIIDATEGGARKEGTEVMTLAEAIRRHAGRSIPEGLLRIEEAAGSPPVAVRRERVREVLKRRIAEAEDLLADYRTAVRLLTKVVETNRSGRAADAEAEKVIALKKNFRRHGVLYHVLNQIAQADLFIRQKRDRDLDLSEKKGVARQLAQAERDLEYVRGLRAALEFMVEKMRPLPEKLTVDSRQSTVDS